MRSLCLLVGIQLLIVACTNDGGFIATDGAAQDGCTTDSGGGRDCGDARADGAKAVCVPGMDQTCNDNPTISSLHGRCKADRTCTCTPPFVMNQATGLCR